MIDLKNKTILITGGTGFIGSHLVNKLVSMGCDITLIERNIKNLWRLDDKNSVMIYNINPMDYEEVRNAINKIRPDIIFHLLANVNLDRDINNIEGQFYNFMITKNILTALDNIDYELFINTGTCEEYGDIQAPFHEYDRESPVSPYSLSKVSITYMCDMMSRIYDKPIITVRPFLTYGPKHINDMLIPSLIKAGVTGDSNIKLTPGEQTRDLIYVEDVVNAYIQLAENAEKVKDKGIFNIGSGKEIRIDEIVEIIETKLNTKFNVNKKYYRKGENQHFYCSIDKIKKEINWEPKWNLSDGLDETIKWWREYEER